ncbi:DUF3817 domain-containing protein [Hymenobacter volaticus]|uniref:DUF3817 domain-containing protein n=1 Tax=Hymenobacter volaticus TaxID=2932254 RepID=A0ABY4GEY7_9BACT|nr:DUF3817 domain-containing protein [Hymenobacter volaticus]UOQ69493.1 DUF3817 domain-containing protein [Hymenobacter volaticus]
MQLPLLGSLLGRLRIVGFLEGLSFLLLLGVAMPLKYFVGVPQVVRILGMAHGLLFVVYVVLVIQASLKFNWSLQKGFGALVVALLPFGPFWADKNLFR